MDIQAAILWEQKQPLSVEAAVLDAPGPGEVLVEVKAAGVCHSDRPGGDAGLRRRSRRPVLGAGMRRVPAVPRGARGALRSPR